MNFLHEVRYFFTSSYVSDLTPPVVNIYYAPNNISNDRTPDFGFYCTNDWTSCSAECRLFKENEVIIPYRDCGSNWWLRFVRKALKNKLFDDYY